MANVSEPKSSWPKRNQECLLPVTEEPAGECKAWLGGGLTGRHPIVLVLGSDPSLLSQASGGQQMPSRFVDTRSHLHPHV